MGNAKYIGRVGGLAVALGIGAAVASWPGAAIAESPAADSATSAETSSDSSSATADSDSTGDAESDPTPDTADTSAAADAEDVDPRSGVVTATGGAETGASADRQNQEAAGEDPDLVEPDDDELGGDELSQVADDPPSDDTVASSSPAPAQANDTRRVVAATTNRPQSLSRNPIDPVGASAAASWSTAQEYGVSNVHFPTAPTAPIEQAQVTRTMSIAAGTPSAPTGVVTNLVTGLLGLIGMGPAASSSPLAPVEPPFVSALLAWVRRQVQQTFFNQTPTAAPSQPATPSAGPVTGTLNASDAEGDPLRFTVTRAPTNGTVVVNADGTYVYTPNAGPPVDDSFEVKVTDVGFHLHLSNFFAPDFGASYVVTVPVDVAEAVVGTRIPVDDQPSIVEISSDGSRAYVLHALSSRVSVIDTATGTVVATIPIGAAGWRSRGLALHPDGTQAYVTTQRPDGVAFLAVIDTATNTVTKTILIGGFTTPNGVAVDANGVVYVTAFGNISNPGIVGSIDVVTGMVTPLAAVGRFPGAVAVKPGGSQLYVTNFDDDTVSVVSGAAVIANIPVGDGPGSIAFNSNGTRAYVSNVQAGTVSVIDTTTNTVVKTIVIGDTPAGLTVSPDGTAVYVTAFGSGKVTVIDAVALTVVEDIPVPDGPADVAFTPDGQRAYVTRNNDDSVSVITFT